METAVLLAKVGANATVVSAGLLHDTIDDSFMDYDYIFKMFGAGVADLVEGVCYYCTYFFFFSVPFFNLPINDTLLGSVTYFSVAWHVLFFFFL